jgi:heptosyltransferase-2
MQSFEHFLKRIFLRIIGLVLSRRQFNAATLPLGSFKRILVIRQHDQLGDLLIATPAIRAIRKKFPGAFIAVVVREYTAPVVECNPYVDEVVVFYEKLWRWNYHRLVSFWSSLRANHGFDCAIVLNTISRSFSSDMIALLSNATYIVGPDHLSLDQSIPERIYNVLSPRSSQQRTEIERNLDIVRTLGDLENDYNYDLVLTDGEVTEAEKVFQSIKVSANKKIVGIHFGAQNPTKRLPLEKLVQIIEWMIEKYRVEVILIISPNEIERRDFILSRLHHKVYSAPMMPLRIMAAFLRHLNLFICNDTGTLHIAASQRVPTVSFHSLSDPAIWKPPHARHIAVRAGDALIASITVEQIQAAVTAAMKNIGGKR